MLLKLQKYDLTVTYVKGKELHVADTLSRAYLATHEAHNTDDLDIAVHAMIQNLPVSDAKLSQIQNATSTDEQLQELDKIIRTGWPSNINNVPVMLRDYWKIRHNLYSADNFIFMNRRLVIPTSMRSEILKSIHMGHMGIEKSKSRARACVYWPGMYNAIELEVKKCPTCNKNATANQKEPMLPHPVPSRPWEKLGLDYFTLGGKDYLLIVDYFSKYPEVLLMNSKTADVTIAKMKSIFARHGIPNVVVADNMPFGSRAFQQFAKEWGFKVVTSSPTYPQSNGLAERNVQSIKRLFKKAREEGKDEMMALLELRNTPVAGLQESPAQLLMSRRLRSSLPMTAAMLKPQISKGVKAALEDRQARQKYYYDRSAKSLPELKPNDVVRFPGNKSWEPAVVVSKHPSPRSYDIKTAQGTYLRRNRRHLRKTVELSPPPATGFIDDDCRRKQR